MSGPLPRTPVDPFLVEAIVAGVIYHGKGGAPVEVAPPAPIRETTPQDRERILAAHNKRIRKQGIWLRNVVFK